MGNDALKAVHGTEYTVGCTPCLLCKYITFNLGLVALFAHFSCSQCNAPLIILTSLAFGKAALPLKHFSTEEAEAF